jgi:hypothetical protein
MKGDGTPTSFLCWCPTIGEETLTSARRGKVGEGLGAEKANVLARSMPYVRRTWQMTLDHLQR